MFPQELLPSRRLQIEDVQIETNHGTVYLTLSGSNAGSRCPTCGAYSERVHSIYERHLTDLPCSGLSVEITLYARRFFCTTADCRQKIFTERWPGMVAPYGRRSERLDALVTLLAQSVGGRSSRRLLKHLQVDTSLWSILRVLRKKVVPMRPTPRILGVDDWAMRRGRRYGTLLANLESGQVVDVLPDREAETLATWLKSHPGVEVISRDRAGAYAEGARSGAPNAVQVADRWRLLKNAGEMLTRVFDRHHRELKQVAQAVSPTPPVTAEMRVIDPPPTVIQPSAKRRARFEQVHALHTQGFTISAIARHAGLDRKTVRRYLSLEALPAFERAARQRYGALAPYQSYLLEHWQQGRRTVRQLWYDLQQQGFRGSLSVVAAFMAQARKQQGLPPYVRTALQCPVLPRHLTARQATWIVLARPEQLDEQDQHMKALLPTMHPEMEQGITAALLFAQLVRERLADQFDAWLQTALRSPLCELRSFARGIQRDYDAVLAALRFPWSNGLLEGHVNRLKFIKRQMFGRATFHLLRLRVLAYET